jgi:hypothetical protein
LSAGPDEILWELVRLGVGREYLEELEAWGAGPEEILWGPEGFGAGRECLEELDGMGTGADPDEFLEELEVFGAGRDLTRAVRRMCLNGRTIVACGTWLVMRTLARPPGSMAMKTPTSLMFR